MRIGILNLHDKANYLAYVLSEAGFDLAEQVDVFDYELIMVDNDHPLSPPIPQKHEVVREAAKRGIPIVMYPHGGPPDLDYDGIRKAEMWKIVQQYNQYLKAAGKRIDGRYEPPPISLQLLHGEGAAEVYRRSGLGHRFEAVGWMYGPVSPLSGPYIEPKSLLFAPIHPWGNGTDILPPHKQLNRQAYAAFLEHPAPIKTVRLYGADDPNGVYERVDGVQYVQSDLSVVSSMLTVREHDAVISYGTLAYASLAMGKPTVFIYGWPGHTADGDMGIVPTHFDDYQNYVKYPACVNEAPLDELFARDVSEWRDLFVGTQLDVDKLAGLLRRLKPNRAVRRKLAKVA